MPMWHTLKLKPSHKGLMGEFIELSAIANGKDRKGNPIQVANITVGDATCKDGTRTIIAVDLADLEKLVQQAKLMADSEKA